MKLTSVLTICLTALFSASTWAAYPDKPIRALLGFAPGGGSDILLRAMTPAMSAALGQQVVVENRAGAGGNLAMEMTARAPADGYTILLGAPGLATNTALYKNLSFDPLKDLIPIALVASAQNVLITTPSLPVNSVAELIQYAKRNPGKLNYASAGGGTSLHLVAELFKASAGIDMVHVPYKGGGQAVTDVMSGQVQLMFNVLQSAVPQIKGNTVKALAVTGAKRSDALPGVPTMIEVGLPGFVAVTWNGFVAPVGTPRDVVNKLNEVIVRILRTPEMRQKLAEMGLDPAPGTPEEFGTLIREETEKWRKIILAGGITAQ
jgi:tripartite-type tricarboxylate transporter receptor subunit TctC